MEGNAEELFRVLKWSAKHIFAKQGEDDYYVGEDTRIAISKLLKTFVTQFVDAEKDCRSAHGLVGSKKSQAVGFPVLVRSLGLDVLLGLC